MDVAFPHLRGVHGSFALAPGPVVFTGMGGEIRDDPGAIRDESAFISDPAWEGRVPAEGAARAEGASALGLDTTAPATRGRDRREHYSATLLKTYSPRVAVIAADEPSASMLGKTLVILPGCVDEQYAERSRGA